MTDIQVENINNAWSMAMYMYHRREAVDYSTSQALTTWYCYHNEYLRWVKVWQTLFNSAM